MKQLIAIGLLLLAGSAMAQVTPVAPPGTMVSNCTGGTVAPTAGTTVCGVSMGLTAVFTYSGAALSTQRLFNNSLTISGTTSTSTPSGYVNAVYDTAVPPASGYIDEYKLYCEQDGGNYQGTRNCSHSVVNFTATPNSGALAADTSSRDLVSNLAEGYAQAPWGGTSGTPAGNLTGYNANVRLPFTGGYWNVLTGAELDVFSETASLFRRYGLLIDMSGSVGSGDDAFIEFNGAANANYGIEFGNSFGASNTFPIGSTGTMIGVVESSGFTASAAYGVDLRNVTFSGYSFASPGFYVDPIGNLTGNTVLASQASPSILWDQTSAGTNLGWWGCNVASTVFACETLTDAEAAGQNWLSVARGATTAVSSISFGNATANPSFTFLGTGTVTASGAYVGARMSVNGTAAPSVGIYAPATNQLGFSTGSTAAGDIDSTQHWRIGGTSVPSIASGACGAGTNGTITGNDQAGTITISSATASTCAITFASTWTNTPRGVQIQAANAGAAGALTGEYISALSTTGFTITGTLASTTWYYWVQ